MMKHVVELHRGRMAAWTTTNGAVSVRVMYLMLMAFLVLSCSISQCMSQSASATTVETPAGPYIAPVTGLAKYVSNGNVDDAVTVSRAPILSKSAVPLTETTVEDVVADAMMYPAAGCKRNAKKSPIKSFSDLSIAEW